jgi:hypothetical protein
MPTRKEAEERIVAKSLEDAEFRSALMANPKAVLAQELGGELPDDIEIEVIEETDSKFYLVLPPVMVEEELSDEQLEAVAGGGCWIGGSDGCYFITRS